MKQFSILFLFLNLFNTLSAVATHTKGGYITAERVSNNGLTYKIRIVTLTDNFSNVWSGGGEVDFGDGTIIDLAEGEDIFERENLTGSSGRISLSTAEFSHTFPAPGFYSIGYKEKNRNAGVLNFSNSVDTPFYIISTLLIDPFLGANNLPVFENFKFPNWFSGQNSTFNLAAFDQDGDSLSFRLGIPRKSKDSFVESYQFPNVSSFYGEQHATGNETMDGLPVFKIDPISGDLVWDAPGATGEYTVLIIIDEWREVQGKRYKIGSVSYDIQMVVEEGEVLKPSIIIPENRCYNQNAIITELFQIQSQGNVKVNLYTDVVGAKINNIPIEEYDFDLWKNSYDLIFTYDSKNATKEYHKVVLSVEQASEADPNYYWSKAFFFGLGCDEIIEAPQIITSISQKRKDRVFRAYLTNSLGSITLSQPLNQEVEFYLLDLNGKSVLKERVLFFNGKGQIEYESIPAGIYIANLEIDSHLHRQKVLIQ